MSSVVEGGLLSLANIASVQHKEVMNALRIIQAGQKDFDSRLAHVEYVLLQTTKSLNPQKASDISNLVQNLWRNSCDSRGSQAKILRQPSLLFCTCRAKVGR